MARYDLARTSIGKMMNLAILRHLAVIICMTVCLLGITWQARAAQNIYSIAGVPVDVTADTVIEARQLAEIQGQREGLQRLLQRLTVPDYYSRLPDVSAIDLTRLVRSFGIENEQFSANRYIAEVGATYDSNAVQELLQGRGVPIILEASQPILIVPARRVDGRLAMFEADDPWASAWSHGHNRNTLLDIVLPLGDLLDVTKLQSNANVNQIESGLAAMAERYDTRMAVLIVADGTPEDDQTLTVTRGGSIGWSYDFRGFDLSAGQDDIWDQAVAGVLRRLETPWKADRLVRFDNVDELTVTAPLGDLAAWARIQKALRGMSEVRQMDLRSFSQSEARIRLRFVGGLAQLQRSLESRGLRLAEQAGSWLLRQS